MNFRARLSLFALETRETPSDLTVIDPTAGATPPPTTTVVTAPAPTTTTDPTTTITGAATAVTTSTTTTTTDNPLLATNSVTGQPLVGP